MTFICQKKSNMNYLIKSSIFLLLASNSVQLSAPIEIDEKSGIDFFNSHFFLPKRTVPYNQSYIPKQWKRDDVKEIYTLEMIFVVVACSIQARLERIKRLVALLEDPNSDLESSQIIFPSNTYEGKILQTQKTSWSPKSRISPEKEIEFEIKLKDPNKEFFEVAPTNLVERKKAIEEKIKLLIFGNVQDDSYKAIVRKHLFGSDGQSLKKFFGKEGLLTTLGQLSPDDQKKLIGLKNSTTLDRKESEDLLIGQNVGLIQLLMVAYVSAMLCLQFNLELMRYYKVNPDGTTVRKDRGLWESLFGQTHKVSDPTRGQIRIDKDVLPTKKFHTTTFWPFGEDVVYPTFAGMGWVHWVPRTIASLISNMQDAKMDSELKNLFIKSLKTVSTAYLDLSIRTPTNNKFNFDFWSEFKTKQSKHKQAGLADPLKFPILSRENPNQKIYNKNDAQFQEGFLNTIANLWLTFADLSQTFLLQVNEAAKMLDTVRKYSWHLDSACPRFKDAFGFWAKKSSELSSTGKSYDKGVKPRGTDPEEDVFVTSGEHKKAGKDESSASNSSSTSSAGRDGLEKPVYYELRRQQASAKDHEKFEKKQTSSAKKSLGAAEENLKRAEEFLNKKARQRNAKQKKLKVAKEELKRAKEAYQAAQAETKKLEESIKRLRNPKSSTALQQLAKARVSLRDAKGKEAKLKAEVEKNEELVIKLENEITSYQKRIENALKNVDKAAELVDTAQEVYQGSDKRTQMAKDRHKEAVYDEESERAKNKGRIRAEERLEKRRGSKDDSSSSDSDSQSEVRSARSGAKTDLTRSTNSSAQRSEEASVRGGDREDDDAESQQSHSSDPASGDSKGPSIHAVEEDAIDIVSED